jgi:hypothetical protein
MRNPTEKVKVKKGEGKCVSWLLLNDHFSAQKLMKNKCF